MSHGPDVFNPELDLRFERIVAATPAQIWRAWTTPDVLLTWFTPSPWQTVACEIDLRPGGVFNTTMRSPEGQDFPNFGIFLEVVPNARLVWTNALSAGFRPAGINTQTPCDGFVFTGMIELATAATGTLYRATVLHGNRSDRDTHNNMGFEAGWNQALQQLLALYDL